MGSIRVAFFGLLCLHAPEVVRAASSAAVGDYVASGLGLTSTATSDDIPPTQAVSEGLVTIGGTVFTATKLENGDILVANTTVHPVSTEASYLTASATITGTAGRPGNASSDDCYASWNKYWSASSASKWSSYEIGTVSISPTLTTTTTETKTYPAVSAGTNTFVTTIDETEPVINGGFTISTKTIDTTSTTVYTQTFVPEDIEIYTNTWTQYASIPVSGGVHVSPKPTCRLPSVVPDCQTKWQNYIKTQLAPSPTPPPHCDINAGFMQNTDSVPPCVTTYNSALESYSSMIGGTNRFDVAPVCTAASIGGPLCQSVRDNYQMHENAVFFPSGNVSAAAAFFFNQGTLGFYNGVNTSWTWPTSATLGKAPSCTLGCGRCAVTGGTVQLIYWPATTTEAGGHIASATANATAAGTPAIVSPKPTATGLVTVETLGTTFTSPTLYVSYKSLYASNACGTIGTELGETILAIPEEKPLSSVYAGTIPCDAHFRPTQVWTGTAPFTVADLNEPVPYSIYSSQPWCATYERDQGCTATCPTSAPYKPILVVNNDLLRGMQPAWADCWGDIRGVYDPPIALTQASSAAAPINPNSDHSASGTSVSSPAKNSASPTAAPDNLPTGSDPVSGPKLPAQSDKGNTDKPEPSASPDPMPTMISVGSQQYTVKSGVGSQSAVQIVNGEQTLTAGGSAATVGGTQISVGTQGIIVGDSTVAMDPKPTPVIATIGSQVISTDPSHSNVVVIGSQTLSVGGSAMTISGTPVSVATNGIIVGDSTIARNPDNTSPSDPKQTIAKVGSEEYTISELSGKTSAVQIVNDGKTKTLTPGQVTTLGTEVFSAGPSGKIFIGTGSKATTVDALQTSKSSSSSSSSEDHNRTTSSKSSNTADQASATSSSATSTSTNRGDASRSLMSSGLGLTALLLGVCAL